MRKFLIFGGLRFWRECSRSLILILIGVVVVVVVMMMTQTVCFVFVDEPDVLSEAGSSEKKRVLHVLYYEHAHAREFSEHFCRLSFAWKLRRSPFWGAKRAGGARGEEVGGRKAESG